MTNFPTGLDTLNNPAASDYLDDAPVYHDEQHININDAMEAVQARIGITGSAVTTSITYQLAVRRSDGIGSTPTDALQFLNATAAGAGAQQYSPAVRFTGQGWKTDTGGASQAVDFRMYNQPLQGAAAPTGRLLIDASINGGAFANIFTLTSTGALTINSLTSAASSWIGWTGRSFLSSPSDGVITVHNTAGADFGRLQFGGTTSSFPALKRSGSVLQCRNGDDSNYTNFIALGLFTPAAGTLNFETRSVISSPADGNLRLTNNAQTDFSLLQFGGTTSSFPALKRSTTELQVRLADDSANATLRVSHLRASGFVEAGATNEFFWVGRSVLTSPADGNIRLTNNAATDFGLLQFGGTTSSFPALKRSSAVLQCRLADDSGGAQLQAGSFVATGIIEAGASSRLAWTGRSQMQSSTTGQIHLMDAAGTGFDMLQFGGTTSSFPALKRSSAELQCALADNSAFAAFRALRHVLGEISAPSTPAANTATLYAKDENSVAHLFYKDDAGTEHRIGQGYTIQLCHGTRLNPVNDSTTYYVGFDVASPVSTTYVNAQVRVPKAGTIKHVFLNVRCTGVTATTETVSHYLRLNDTTDFAQMDGTYDFPVNAYLHLTATPNQLVAAGDMLALKIVTPAFATNPTLVAWNVVIYIE